MSIVATLLRQFGPTSGAGSPPVAASLSVVDNGDGTQTATISGGSSGASNVVYVQSFGSSSFSPTGSRTGNGTVALSLAAGRYFAYVRSTMNDQVVAGYVIAFTVLAVSEAGLEHSPAYVLMRLMIDLGFGSNPLDQVDWPITVGQEPDKPDNCITFYNTSGELGGRSAVDGEFSQRPGIQIRVRSQTAVVGWTKIQDLQLAMDQNVRQTEFFIDSTQYKVWMLSRKGTIFHLGTEIGASKRHIFTLNYVISLRKLN